MKKHFLILLALISVHIAQAQTSDKAMKLYEQTKTKINSLKNYSFSFTMLSGENYFDGNIKVKGEKFKIELEGLSMIYDGQKTSTNLRSEEHTSELQSRENLVCRLLLEKKKEKTKYT